MDSNSRNIPSQSSLIGTIIVNSIASPLTVLFNILVIMAVRRRARLRNKANISLAFLAVTDLLTGVVAQPSFVLWKTLLILGTNNVQAAVDFHNNCLAMLNVSSCLHLILVACERLVAIKFPFHYPYIVTTRNIKSAVVVCWIYSTCCLIGRLLVKAESTVRFLLVAHVLAFSVVFVSSSYVILYLETRRHQKIIKTQQLPREEVERFLKESKALKTTALVVGAVVFCLLPGIIFFSLKISGLNTVKGFQDIYTPWARTFAMLNSLLNPMIYCWRQKEMRKFLFNGFSQAVHPD